MASQGTTSSGLLADEHPGCSRGPKDGAPRREGSGPRGRALQHSAYGGSSRGGERARRTGAYGRTASHHQRARAGRPLGSGVEPWGRGSRALQFQAPNPAALAGGLFGGGSPLSGCARCSGNYGRTASWQTHPWAGQPLGSGALQLCGSGARRARRATGPKRVHVGWWQHHRLGGKGAQAAIGEEFQQHEGHLLAAAAGRRR